MQTKAEGSNLRALCSLTRGVNAGRNLDAIFHMCSVQVPHLDVPTNLIGPLQLDGGPGVEL
jgi:hypothetical protein